MGTCCCWCALALGTGPDGCWAKFSLRHTSTAAMRYKRSQGRAQRRSVRRAPSGSIAEQPRTDKTAAQLDPAITISPALSERRRNHQLFAACLHVAVSVWDIHTCVGCESTAALLLRSDVFFQSKT